MTTLTDSDFNEFFLAYKECAVWASVDDDGDPIEDVTEELSPKCREEFIKDCKAFLSDEKTVDMVMDNIEHAGHDFWLTRNHHGSGFFDSYEIWDDEERKYLDERAHGFSECHLYVGDDHLLYCE